MLVGACPSPRDPSPKPNGLSALTKGDLQDKPFLSRLPPFIIRRGRPALLTGPLIIQDLSSSASQSLLKQTMYSAGNDSSSTLKFEPHADHEPEFTGLYNSDCPFLVAKPENGLSSWLKRPRAMLNYLQIRISKFHVIAICLSAIILWV